MDDLTPYDPTNSLPEKPISPVLSPELKSLLVDDENSRWAVVRIAEDAELRAEALASLPVLRAAAMQKAGEIGVRQVIGRRFAIYPQPERSDGEWAAWWADYLDVLADLPWHALEAGMAAWVAAPDSEFLPKPGKLLDLANTSPVRVVRAYQRAREALDYRPPPPPVDPEVLAKIEAAAAVRSMEEATKIKRMAAETVAAIRGERSRLPQIDLPSTAGKPDETGITPQMRALISKRAQEDNTP